jgi:hypothetical protein
VCDLLTFERLAELLAVVADGRDGGGDLERRHRGASRPAGMMQGMDGSRSRDDGAGY